MFSIKKTILLVCTFAAFLDVASAAQCSNNNDNNPADIYYVKTTKEKPIFCAKEYWTIVDSHPITFKKQPQGDIWLVVGNTGAGKSTIANYALGHGLTKVKLKDIKSGKIKPIGIDVQLKKAGNQKVVVITKKKEAHNIASIGILSAKSCTVIPALYPTYIDDVLLLDCPGFEDTKGIEQKLFNILMIRSMLENATSVQILLVVVAYEELASKGCKVFIDMLHQLLVFFPSMLDHMDQVHFLINKAIEMEKEDVIDLIEEAAQEKETQLKNTQKNHPDNWQKLWEQKPALKEMLLLNSVVKSANIYIVDPLDKGKSWQVAYQAIQKKIQPGQSIAKDSFSLNIPGIDVVGTLTPVYDKEISTIRKLVENVYVTRLSIHHDTQSIQRMQEHQARVKEGIDLPPPNVLQAQYDNLQQAIDTQKLHIQKLNSKEKVLHKEQELYFSNLFCAETHQITYKDLPYIDYQIKNKKNYTETIHKKDAKGGLFIADYTKPIDWKTMSLTAAIVSSGFLLSNQSSHEKKDTPKENPKSENLDTVIATFGIVALVNTIKKANLTKVTISFYVEARQKNASEIAIQTKQLKQKEEELLQLAKKKEVINIKDQISHLKKNIAQSKQQLNEITHHLQNKKTKQRMHYFHNNRTLINKLFIREQIQKSLDLIKKYIEENNHQDDEKKDNQ